MLFSDLLCNYDAKRAKRSPGICTTRQHLTRKSRPRLEAFKARLFWYGSISDLILPNVASPDFKPHNLIVLPDPPNLGLAHALVVIALLLRTRHWRETVGNVQFIIDSNTNTIVINFDIITKDQIEHLWLAGPHSRFLSPLLLHETK
jgi:hypothetical protein